MARIVTEETSYSSVNTYYNLDLNNVTRNGSNITFTFYLYVNIGSGTSAGTSYPRTFYLYMANGTLMGSYAIKPSTVSWNAGNVYDYSFSITYNVGTSSAWSSTCYARILNPTNFSQNTPAIWNGSKETSGGTVGQTFVLSAAADGSLYVNVGGVWQQAIPYVNVNGVWRQAIPYVNVEGVWRQASV